jgi:hypothetical protein
LLNQGGPQTGAGQTSPITGIGAAFGDLEDQGKQGLQDLFKPDTPKH